MVQLEFRHGAGSGAAVHRLAICLEKSRTARSSSGAKQHQRCIARRPNGWFRHESVNYTIRKPRAMKLYLHVQVWVVFLTLFHHVHFKAEQANIKGEIESLFFLETKVFLFTSDGHGHLARPVYRVIQCSTW